MSRAIFFACVACACLLVGRTAHACSCAEQTPEQHFESAAAVFEGVIVATEDPASTCTEGCLRKHTFRISRAWKGEALKQERIDVRTEPQGSMCGANFQDGAGYLVFAEMRPNGLFAHLCGGSVPEKYAHEIRDTLGAGITPVHPNPEEPVAVPDDKESATDDAAGKGTAGTSLDKTKPAPGGCRGCASTHGSSKPIAVWAMVFVGYFFSRRRPFPR